MVGSHGVLASPHPSRVCAVPPQLQYSLYSHNASTTEGLYCKHIMLLVPSTYCSLCVMLLPSITSQCMQYAWSTSHAAVISYTTQPLVHDEAAPQQTHPANALQMQTGSPNTELDTLHPTEPTSSS
jgi:hypothetical protein